MAKKIQVTTVKQTADIEVIALNSYFIAKAVRAHDTLDRMIEQTKQVQQIWNDNESKWEPALDDNGNPRFSYCCEWTQIIEENVYPLLKELMHAFEIDAPVE